MADPGAQRSGGHASDLAAVMAGVARQLQHEHGDVEATLQAITGAAVATIARVQHSGISLVTGRRTVEPRAWTGELPRLLDSLQQEVGQGPCMDAAWTQDVVRSDDLRTEDRWPEFAARASAAGVGSMLCFQLFVRDDRLGALNLYADQAHAFDEPSLELGQMLASHAAIALAGAQHEQNLAAGITHRDAIGQAKGILMERYKITADAAFGVLVRTSSLTNRKLRDVADKLSATGELPTP